MPTYQITGPDGRKYRVTGDSPEGAAAAVKKMIGQTEPARQPMDASTVFVDEMLFGLPGMASAGLNALVRAPFTEKSIGEEYRDIRDDYTRSRDQYAQENPMTNLAASVGGGIMGSGGVIGLGGTAARAVAPRLAGRMQAGIGGKMTTDAAAGAGIGAASAVGHDENIASGAMLGAGLGAAARPLTQAASGAISSVGGMLGLGNARRAQTAISEAVERSGKTPAQLTQELAAAARDGQGEYMLADALGNSGQRMLSGVARAPGDMRQTIAETLQRRQAGQGDRLVNALSEGFNAPDTAAQRTASLTASRDALANVNYSNARQAANPVNLNGALRQIDNLLGRDPILGDTALSRGPMGTRLKALRDQMQRDGEQLVDFNRVLDLKSDLFQQMQRNPDVASEMRPVYQMLDQALERSSPQYRAANDAFRAQSRTIDAVDKGRAATSSRARSTDTIQQFRGMQPGEQNAFRAGYADPLIARVESASMSPTTNKARALITGKTAEEFPAFAIPQRANRMGDRIAREQRMFETANAALGGSKTADNLADAAEMGVFDPSMIGNIATGNIRGAMVQALTRGAQGLQGRNQQTRDMIAKMLLQSSPTRVNAEIAQAVQAGKQLTKKQQAVVNALMGATIPQAAAF